MLKTILRTIITAILRFEARLVLKKYRPKIVGITGSVGKTGTKDAVARILGSRFRVRASQKSFNHELGVPLTILNCDNAWWSISGWIKNILEGLSLIVFRASYPEWLVLEIGVEQPGDIDRITRWVKFDLVVITRLPEIPVHVEFFSSPEAVSQEKLKLARAVGPQGVVILNHDDAQVIAVREALAARVLTYGFDQAATVRATAEQVVYAELEGRRLPDGLEFTVNYQDQSAPVRLRQILARHQIYGALAGLASGLALGLPLGSLTLALEELPTPPGRFRLIAGLKDSIIIDDSYNASPAAVAAALETFGHLETGGRKITVLGDMLELGPLTIEAHRQLGPLAASVSDLIVTVGLRTKFLAEAAAQKRFSKKKLFHFDTWQGVGEMLQNLIEPGDLILIKGSQSMRLEKVVEEIMAHPEDKDKLLVRQDPEWQKR